MSWDWLEMAKKSTFGLTPAQLGRLLAVSARTVDSADAMVEDQAKEKLLQEHLSRRLSDALSSPEVLPSGTEPPVAETVKLPDGSLKEALLDPQCDLAVLRTIKDHNKRLSAMVASGSQTLITATLYYAAVAAALVYQNQRISQYSHEDLAERFLALTQRSWIDRDLRGLFARAAALCRQTRTNRE